MEGPPSVIPIGGDHTPMFVDVRISFAALQLDTVVAGAFILLAVAGSLSLSLSLCLVGIIFIFLLLSVILAVASCHFFVLPPPPPLPPSPPAPSSSSPFFVQHHCWNHACCTRKLCPTFQEPRRKQIACNLHSRGCRLRLLWRRRKRSEHT